MSTKKQEHTPMIEHIVSIEHQMGKLRFDVDSFADLFEQLPGSDFNDIVNDLDFVKQEFLHNYPEDRGSLGLKRSILLLQALMNFFENGDRTLETLAE